MDYALYKKDGGSIISVLQTDMPLGTAPEGYDYILFPYNLDDSANYHVVDGRLQLRPANVLEEEAKERAWVMLRRNRNALLTASDWTQVPDAPVDHLVWAAYRQALRDLPASVDDPLNFEWPEAPAL